MLVELSTNPAGYLRAAFRFSEPRPMRVELDISMANGESADATSALLSIRRLIDDSSHSLSPHEGCGECNWYGLMALVRRCHEQAREMSAHVMTTVHIEDEDGNESIAQAVKPARSADKLAHI
jgi:uncharacterized protein YqgV (UPF0045/DUF77 family)